MWTGVLKSLTATVVSVVAMCGLILPTTALSQETISSKKYLNSALENAVLCKMDALNIFNGSLFSGALDDPKHKLESLGVKITDEPQHGGELRYRLPPGTKVFGYEASEALYSSPSTTIFFINLHAGPESLPAISKILRLARVPEGNPDGYGFFDQFDASYVRKLGDGVDSPPDTIFSAKRKGQNYIIIGCQNLAW